MPDSTANPASLATLLRDDRLIPLLIVVVGILAYLPSLSAPFYFDDWQCIVNNPVVRDLSNYLHLDEFRQLGISEDIRNNLVTRWVVYLTFAANYRLHGLDVTGYHLVNLAIHLGSAILIYHLVAVTRRLAAGREAVAPGGDRFALLVALLFVAHPIQTNAVTYIVQRFTSLATFFYLATLLAYVSAVLSGATRLRWVALVTALLAMYSKEIAASLPLMLALYDVTFLSGDGRARLRRLLPFVLLLPVVPVTVMALAANSQVTGGEAGRALDLVNFSNVSRADYFVTQWRVIVTYLRLLVVPVGLNFDHDMELYDSPWHADVLLSGALVFSLFALGGYLLWRGRQVGAAGTLRLAGFGILWFFIALSLVASIVPLADLLTEYRLYLPSVGLILALTTAGEAVLMRLAAWHGRLLPLTAGMIVVVLALATVERNRLWQDDVRFWRDVVGKSPGKVRPLANLAVSLARRGGYDEALAQLRLAQQFEPDNMLPYYQSGLIYETLGRLDEAVAAFHAALRLNPGSLAIHVDLGRLYLKLGNFVAAAGEAETLLGRVPNHPEGLALMRRLVQEGYVADDRGLLERGIPHS